VGHGREETLGERRTDGSLPLGITTIRPARHSVASGRPMRHGSGVARRIVTRPDLVRDLTGLGVAPGQTLLVHSSLRAVAGPDGLVVGGAVAVIDALTEALGDDGTLVMPAHSASLSEPSRWSNPPIDPAFWPTVRELWPPFRPDATPTQAIGVIPEVFRSMDGVERSDHPQVSFCARGPAAAALLRDHPLSDGLGEGGPLGRLRARGAQGLLLGCGWESCTAFHLAEHALPDAPRHEEGAPLLRDGRRAWVTFDTLAYDADDFGALGAAFEATGAATAGQVGHAHCRLFELPAAVAFATEWLRDHRVSGPASS